MLSKFWDWYNKNYKLTIGLTAGLFLLQIVHLIWLFGEVIWMKITGHPLFVFTGIWEKIIILVDYTEIPALVSSSLVYLNDLRSKWKIKSLLYFFFLNSQWLHILWITDEFVVNTFTNTITLPVWLAWVAILIDYLEVPVIFDILRKFFISLKKKEVGNFIKNEFSK
jgi:hypothetical protein